MTTREGFGQTHDIAITVLVDNRADLMVESTETIKYFKDAPLLAEHGFSALLELKSEGIRILWDAGVTDIALLENMRRMKIDPSSIDKIAISHGHHDHTASVLDLLEAMSLTPEAKEWPADSSAKDMASYAQGKRVPLIVHPAAFRERWSLDDEGKWYGPRGRPPKARWEAAGGEIVVSAEPYQLGQGCWTTGYVTRRSFEHSGRPSKMRYRDDLEFRPDDLEEDQAIVINVADKGLVVLSGCAHSGIVNTVTRAREISGVERTWAIIGGFHLGRAEDQEVQQTIDGIKELNPSLIVPAHCTGFKAATMFARQMPDAFVPGIVGATYLF